MPTKFVLNTPKGRVHLEDLGINGRQIILELFVENHGEKYGTGFMGSSFGLLCTWE
jgi:hypothetical protein